jgi:hypothetical protein
MIQILGVFQLDLFLTLRRSPENAVVFSAFSIENAVVALVYAIMVSFGASARYR